jgi:hypothetical protein
MHQEATLTKNDPEVPLVRFLRWLTVADLAFYRRTSM